MKNVLFITYDGLTDHLGQSQILPYLTGLARRGHSIKILSCEKRNNFTKNKDIVNKIVSEANIQWNYVYFHSSPPIIAKLYDFWQLKRLAVKICKLNKIDVVHCRSYVVSEIGLFLKLKFGCKLLFDMRGFWADERKDSGAWDQSYWFYRKLYAKYKDLERRVIVNSDHIVSLTNMAKNEILSWDYTKNILLNITVIPCCADMDLFTLRKNGEKELAKESLGFSKEDFVVSYLGSLGGLYLVDEMLSLFNKIKKVYKSAKFLFVTPSEPNIVLSKILKYQINKEDVQVVSISRNQVPLYMKSSDVNLSFIKTSYSKKASSPTKNAEVLAMGIPIIANSGIGDVDELAKDGSVYLLANFNESAFDDAINHIPTLLSLSGSNIRDSVVVDYSLNHGVDSYNSVYDSI